MERYLPVAMRIYERISTINRTGADMEKIVPAKMEEVSGVV
jgi:hypothetical protein